MSKKSKPGRSIKALEVSTSKASKVRGGTVQVRPPDAVSAVQRMAGQAVGGVSVDVSIVKRVEDQIPNPARDPVK